MCNSLPNEHTAFVLTQTPMPVTKQQIILATSSDLNDTSRVECHKVTHDSILALSRLQLQPILEENREQPVVMSRLITTCFVVTL